MTLGRFLIPPVRFFCKKLRLVFCLGVECSVLSFLSFLGFISGRSYIPQFVRWISMFWRFTKNWRRLRQDWPGSTKEWVICTFKIIISAVVQTCMLSDWHTLSFGKDWINTFVKKHVCRHGVICSTKTSKTGCMFSVHLSNGSYNLIQ